MDFSIISFILNALLGFAMFLLKSAHDDIKEQLKQHKSELDHIRDTYLKQADFKDFKEELWRRLDKIELSVERKQ